MESGDTIRIYSNLECPYCGSYLCASSDDHDGWPSGADEYTTEVQCPICEEDFKLHCKVDVYYRAERMDS